MSTSTKTQEFTKSLTRLRESLNKGYKAAKTERIGSPSIGDVVRQGDLYLSCIEKLPKGKPSKVRQLVEGTSQGSRHVVKGDCEIVSGAIYTTPKGVVLDEVLCGPAFHCNSDVEVTHPEHGNKILPKGTTWHATYQQSFAETVRRVQD